MEQNISKIKSRILEHIEYQGISKRSFYIKTGISNGILDKKTGLTEDSIEKYISAYPEINPEWLLTGTGEMLKSKDLILTAKQIPFYDAEAKAGSTGISEMTGITAPTGTIDVGDLLRDSEAAIPIYGNSMIPGYPPGCVVGIKKCWDSFIEPGEVYVIETRDSRLLKRLFYRDDDADSEYFTCYSDNVMTFQGGARNGKLAYPPFNIHKKDVIALFFVTGVIKRNRNSHIAQN